MARIEGLGCVVIYSNHPEKLANWYGTVLGIKTEFDNGEELFYSALEDSVTGAQAQFGIKRAKEPLTQGNRSIMVNYRVDDFSAFLDQIRGQNVTIENTMEMEYGKFAYITDPDGNAIEIWERPEGHP